jgi:hypothetical protein
MDDPVFLLAEISNWWEMVPLVSVSMDPYDPNAWPNVWEIIDSGECCKYSKGLAMGYTMHFMDQHAHIELARVLDNYHHDEYIVAIWKDRYVLNSPFSRVTPISEVDSYLSVQESWTIRDVMQRQQEKQ